MSGLPMTTQDLPIPARAGASRRHLLITGTGRAGTSFLVRYLTALGLDTHLARHGDAAAWDEAAHAGLEDMPAARDHASLPYVIKSPWLAFEPEAIGEDLALDAVIVPVRRLEDAAASRIVIERQAMARAQPWIAASGTDWHHWGGAPGGVVYSLEPMDQARLLAVAFHRIVHFALERDVPLILLAFPRMVEDADYLHARLRPVLGDRVSHAEARAAHARVADRAKVRTTGEMRALGAGPEGGEASAPTALHLELLALRRELGSLSRQVAAARADAAAAAARLAATEASSSWRLTAPLRALAGMLRPRS